MQRNHIILGVHIHNRIEHAVQVQKLLTDYGHNIKTRLGLHEIEGNQSSNNGLLLLEMTDFAKGQELADKLNRVEGVEVKSIVFDHP